MVLYCRHVGASHRNGPSTSGHWSLQPGDQSGNPDRFHAHDFCFRADPRQPCLGVIDAKGDVGAQTLQALQNVEAILTEGGAFLKDVVKTTVYVTDLDSFDKINAVYASFFGDSRPARATVEVSALPMGALVEVDAVALVTSPR